MADEKKYSAKDAAVAVLKKAEEVLKKSEAQKTAMKKDGQTLGAAIGFPGAPPTAPVAKAEKDQTPPDGVQKDPNPAAPNDKINGNPAPGAFPQNQEPYAAEMKGHLKLAKFIGHMEHKRKSAAPAAASAAPQAPKLPA